jgi:hypothetical protein
MRIFNLALGAINGGCTIEVARVAMSRLEHVALNDELRARGIRAIAEARHGEVRSWLAKRATTTSWLFRRLRLRKPSLELYAVLGALAIRNEEHPESQHILGLARRSRNQDIRRAATRRVTTQPLA